MCVKEGWVVDLLGLIAEEAGGCEMLGLPLVVGLWLRFLAVEMMVVFYA